MKSIAEKSTYIKSPLNYIGGKHKLLPQIIPLFPDYINTFVDLFGGGFNVGINVKANKVYYNDLLPQVMLMLQYFKLNKLEDMLRQIDSWIEEYQLNKTNQDGFLTFRDYYNSNKNPLALYTLICYAFNNQIRFNSKGGYNMPFGKNRSSFNPTLREKFIEFVTELQKKDCDFFNRTFKDLKLSKLTLSDLVYCDPPYFNSTATYNESGGWTQEDENTLLNLLDELNSKKVKFALSNNLTVNPALKEWADSKGYTIHNLSCNYSNCNYQKKDKKTKDIEVLITNY